MPRVSRESRRTLESILTRSNREVQWACGHTGYLRVAVDDEQYRLAQAHLSTVICLDCLGKQIEQEYAQLEVEDDGKA